MNKIIPNHSKLLAAVNHPNQPVSLGTCVSMESDTLATMSENNGVEVSTSADASNDQIKVCGTSKTIITFKFK